MTFADMEMADIKEYAELFVSVFNAPPWNDGWTNLTARMRIGELLNTGNCVGKAAYENGQLIGIILGQKEHSYDGVHFQIQEFCVRTENQRSGCGTRLLAALKDELNALGVVNIYLITQSGESTESYFQKRGFTTSGQMIVMSENLTK